MAGHIIASLAEFLLSVPWLPLELFQRKSRYVITLIGRPLTEEIVQQVARMTESCNHINWVVPEKVADLQMTEDVLKQISIVDILPSVIGASPIDYIFQGAKNRRKKLLIADMESTIITCECLDELAELVGIRDKIANITARAMNGELDFAEALRERVGLLKGLPESALQKIMDEKVRLMPGARELVSTMKKHGAYCMLVSGGFDFFTSRVAEMLGFDEHRSNKLEIVDGKLTGNVIAPILGKEAKLQALQEAYKKLGITPDDALAVGDGANDLPMLLAAGLGVAFHAKPNVRAQAKARIDHADLRALLWAQGISA